MKQEIAISLFTDNPDLLLEFNHARKAYGLSKMTIPNDNEYEGIKLVEFLEMIARAA